MHFSMLTKTENGVDPYDAYERYVYDSVEYSEFDDQTEDVVSEYEKDCSEDPSFRILYPTVESYNENEYHASAEISEDGTVRFGFWGNPYGFCDWCSLGGRFGYPFLVKNDTPKDEELADDSDAVLIAKQIHAICNDEPDSIALDGPGGYHWTPIALKKNIDWEKMREAAIKEETQRYNMLQDMLDKKREVEFPYEISGDTIYNKMNSADTLKKSCTLEDFLKEIDYIHRKYPIRVYGTLDAINYDWPNEGVSYLEIENFINDTDDDECLFIMDCHS